MTEVLELAVTKIFTEELGMSSQEAAALLASNQDAVLAVFHEPLRHMKSDRRLASILLQRRGKLDGGSPKTATRE
jgi:hypothetical protein